MTKNSVELLEPSDTLRIRILEAAAESFNSNGVRMKMEDISRSIAISKKTIYTVFPDKESLLSALVEDGFNRIKESKREIIEDENLTTLAKLQKVIIAMPESLKKIDYHQFHEVALKYPKLFKLIQSRIEGEWEPTIQLLDQAVAEGVIRPVSVTILKLMVEASIEHFLDSETLTQAGIPYTVALETMMDILLNGLRTPT